LFFRVDASGVFRSFRNAAILQESPQ